MAEKEPEKGKDQEANKQNPLAKLLSTADQVYALDQDVAGNSGQPKPLYTPKPMAQRTPAEIERTKRYMQRRFGRTLN